LPYQLHLLAPVHAALLELDTGFELEVVVRLEELFALVDAELLVTTTEHTEPVTTGFSGVPPLASPCTPKLMVCPG